MAEERWELTNEQWKTIESLLPNYIKTNLFCPKNPHPYQSSANLGYAQPKDFL